MVNYDDLKTAVMRAMWPLPYIIPTFLLNEKDLPSLKDARERCSKWRKWAENEPALDKQTRRAYLEWVEYCENRNNEAEQEILYGRQKKEFAEYKERLAKESKRVNEISVLKPDKL